MRLLSRFKIGVASFVLCVPLFGSSAIAQSQNTALDCRETDAIVEKDVQDMCDIAIQKRVKVNSGSFVDANDPAGAPTAFVGDTITWEISVSNASSVNQFPGDVVYIHDTLPAGLSFVSASATNGSSAYDQLTDTWIVDTDQDLTAVLTIVTTATTIGTITNTASIDEIDYCSEGCFGAFIDDNSENNSDSATVNVVAPPQVLGATTTTSSPAVLAATGSSSLASIAAGLLALLAVLVAVLSRRHAGVKVSTKE